MQAALGPQSAPTLVGSQGRTHKPVGPELPSTHTIPSAQSSRLSQPLTHAPKYQHVQGSPYQHAAPSGSLQNDFPSSAGSRDASWIVLQPTPAVQDAYSPHSSPTSTVSHSHSRHDGFSTSEQRLNVPSTHVTLPLIRSLGSHGVGTHSVPVQRVGVPSGVGAQSASVEQAGRHISPKCGRYSQVPAAHCGP